MKKASLFIAAVTVAWSVGAPLSPPALAQELNLGPIIGPEVGMHAAAQQAVIDDINKGGGAKSKGQSGRGAKGRGAKGRGPRTKAKAATGSTRFRPSLATRKSVIAAYVARARARDAKSGEGLGRDLAKTDPIASAKPGMARFGLRTDDVADAVAIYLVSAWYGARGSRQDPPRGYLRATREQMHQALLLNPKFAKSSNESKQHLAESLIIETMVIDSAIIGAKGKPELMGRVKSYIRETTLKTFQLDVAKLKLTSNGLQA